MCTLVIVPAADDQLVVAVNRDERLTRATARPPRVHRGGRLDWLAPVDPDGGGTWIAINAAGCSVIVLNDYRTNYQPTEEIRSRGQLVVDLVESSDLRHIEQRLREPTRQFARYRPFILLAAQRIEGGPPRAIEASWDGRQLAIEPVELPRMWVSSGVPGAKAHRARQAGFERFLQNWSVNADDLEPELDALFCAHQPEKGPLSICMHIAPFARTVSHTRVRIDAKHATMQYRAGTPCQADSTSTCRLALRSGSIDSPSPS